MSSVNGLNRLHWTNGCTVHYKVSSPFVLVGFFLWFCGGCAGIDLRLRDGEADITWFLS